MWLHMYLFACLDWPLTPTMYKGRLFTDGRNRIMHGGLSLLQVKAMHERCSYSDSAHTIWVWSLVHPYAAIVAVGLTGQMTAFSACVTLGEISSVLARLMMKHLSSMIPIIAHCNGQFTAVIVITNHLKGMGYRNGVWSTGGAYARVIKHKGWNIPTYNSKN